MDWCVGLSIQAFLLGIWWTALTVRDIGTVLWGVLGSLGLSCPLFGYVYELKDNHFIENYRWARPLKKIN